MSILLNTEINNKSLFSPRKSQEMGFSKNYSEKFYDVIYPLKSILFRSVTGVFLSIPFCILSGLAAYSPSTFMSFIDKDAVHLTEENIKKGIEETLFKGVLKTNQLIRGTFKNDPNPPYFPVPALIPKHLYVALQKRVGDLAKKAGIEAKIDIYINDNSASAIGSNHTKRGIISIPHHFINPEKSDQLDYVIAHELSHIKHNDSLAKFKRTLFIGAMDIVFLPISLIVEIIGTVASNASDRKKEKLADLNALKILNSNKGAIQFIENQIKENIELRKNKDFKNLYTPEGNVREDLVHPTLTEALAYVKNFRFKS